MTANTDPRICIGFIVQRTLKAGDAREIHEQLNSCSCLTLIFACIIYWQANEISVCLSSCRPEELGLDLDCLAHVSPIEWDNVVLYGEYRLDRKLIRSA